MLSIGEIHLPIPAVQAALSGYSDLPMRRVARSLGAPFCFAEVVVDKILLSKGKGRRRALDLRADDHPIGGQLMGAVPETCGEAAGELVAAGYELVDINFGCPVNKVLGRCRGGYHLGQPKIALELVRRVIDAVDGAAPAPVTVPVPVTVKMRRGLDDSKAAERQFFEILDGAFELGIAAVTVHGRTVQQKYVGESDWDFLGLVKKHLGDRVMLGSGDLFRPEDVLAMLERTGVDGVTVARGCIGNPWFFSQLRDLLAGRSPALPTITEQRRVLEMHWREAVAFYGEERGTNKMRFHAVKYSGVHPQAVAVRDAFVKVRKPRQLQAVLEEWYPYESESCQEAVVNRPSSDHCPNQ